MKTAQVYYVLYEKTSDAVRICMNYREDDFLEIDGLLESIFFIHPSIQNTFINKHLL